MKDKIAIIITSIHRDDLLIEAVSSIIDNWQDNFRIIVVDQNKEHSEEKRFFMNAVASRFHLTNEQLIKFHNVPYNCGLSYARNYGVKIATKMNIPYCLISADSIKFNKSINKINDLISYFKRYDLIGLDLKNRKVGWEGKLSIKNNAFELDFIDKTCKFCDNKKLVIFNCDIVRNLFLAKTESLFDIKWDEKLLMSEHEDFFIRYSDKYKVGWTKWCNAEYIGDKSKKNNEEYSEVRKKNFQESQKYLFEKWNLKKWINYKNLHRSKEK